MSSKGKSPLKQQAEAIKGIVEHAYNNLLNDLADEVMERKCGENPVDYSNKISNVTEAIRRVKYERDQSINRAEATAEDVGSYLKNKKIKRTEAEEADE